MPTFAERLQHGWNAFINNKDPTLTPQTNVYWGGYSYRPDRIRLTRGNERSIVNSIYNRIAADVSAVNILHVRTDENERYLEPIHSGLNNVLTTEANLDQTGRALIQDIVMSMFDEGVVACVPVDTTIDPYNSNAYDILTMRTGKITQWSPGFVRVELYNEKTGRKEEISLPKKMVAIMENPFYSIMNEPNSTLQRLIRKLNLLDAIVDPNSAHIDLGTLYKQVEDGKTVLKRDCGIDIDGVTGNINIRSFKQQYDETERKTSENEAKIEVLTQDTKSQISLVTSRINDVSDREKQHYAEIKIWADDTESQINLKADKVTVDALRVSLNATDEKVNKTNDVLTRQCGIDLNAKTGNVNIKSLYKQVDENGKAIATNSARITESTNSLQAKIDINAKSISSHGTRIANVEVKANNLESSITLKADTVTLNATRINLQGQIDSLSASVANIKSLFANTLKANVIEANTIVGQHIIIGGGDNYAISYNALNNKLESYVTKYTFNHHTHDGYASSSHTHSGYASTYHTHSQYALKSHTH